MPLPALPHMTSRRSAVVGMSPDDFSDVALFRERVEKLAVAQKKYQGLPISRTSREDHPNARAFEANTPDVEEVASLARNFRFFYGDSEPTQFQKVLTKVRRRVQDEWACGYLDWLAEQYRGAMKAPQVSADLGLPVPNRTIIDLWFNSELFHSERLKREELASIHTSIGEAPSLFQLYVAIAHCSSYVRMLHAVVHMLSAEHEFVYSPNHHFGRAQKGEAGDV